MAADASVEPPAPARTCRLQPDEVDVITPTAVVVAMEKEEEVGHVIVTKAKEVVEARSATMA